MTFSKKTYSYIFSRNLAIVEVVCQSRMLLREVLSLLISDVYYQDQKITLFPSQTTIDVSQDFVYFWEARQKLFPESKYLFVTNQGARLKSSKYQKSMQSNLKIAGFPEASSHPKKISPEQLVALKKQRFSYRRYDFQKALVTLLLGFYGLRPSEVAKLKVSDFDFDLHILILRNTKGNRRKEELPLEGPVASIAKRYISHLGADEQYLFVKRTGRVWGRKDVTTALQEFVHDMGIPISITSRRLRATYGTTLAELNIPDHIAAALMRHKDPATWLRHYADVNTRLVHSIYTNNVVTYLQKESEK